jgi:hypothetical protein
MDPSPDDRDNSAVMLYAMRVTTVARMTTPQGVRTAMDDTTTPTPTGMQAAADAPGLPPNAAPGKPLSDAARRALEEAAARRAALDAQAEALTAEKEIDGRGGLEPVRYGDWEIKGLTSDF